MRKHCISSISQKLHIIRSKSGIYSFRCKAPLCFALRALLGFSERTEEQSALAPLCKHRLCCWIILLSAQHPRVGCVAPLLGHTERAEEQSALAPLCKHRLSSLDYHPFQRNGISSRLCRVYHQQHSCCILPAKRYRTAVAREAKAQPFTAGAMLLGIKKH